MTLSLTEVNIRLEEYAEKELNLSSASAREACIDELQEIIFIMEKKHAAEKVSGIYDKRHRISILEQEVEIFLYLTQNPCNASSDELAEYEERLKVSQDEINYINNIIELKSNTIYIEE